MNEIPKKCPICEYAGIQTILSKTKPVQGKNFGSAAYMVWVTKCENCQQPAAYRVDLNPVGNPIRFELIVPIATKIHDISQVIMDLSDRFVDTYHQAQIAERYGLTEIAGMGYRKALEILVTDFAMKDLFVTDEEAVKLPLSQLINKIPNEEIRDTAKAGAWIGNDEAHYFRENPNYGIDELKGWLSAFMSYVETVEKTKQASELVNSKNKLKPKSQN
ncbi:hypothetical protein LASUN_22530 [Lentilactobacillus sunkii]|jgi:hypothetical protein|uniref:DUF4145 domain-containing protein n=1 Tax=Lentilactobacillus sunkii TaxID=481719 RepID=A0A1E7X9T8_9LACO|nr:hypothetical protein [Lentilactobacillus sunkii]OFA09771.1 hypothetical protein LASUN_22530 [Lentilactobacillus sunkii]